MKCCCVLYLSMANTVVGMPLVVMKKPQFNFPELALTLLFKNANGSFVMNKTDFLYTYQY